MGAHRLADTMEDKPPSSPVRTDCTIAEKWEFSSDKKLWQKWNRCVKLRSYQYYSVGVWLHHPTSLCLVFTFLIWTFLTQMIKKSAWISRQDLWRSPYSRQLPQKDPPLSPKAAHICFLLGLGLVSDEPLWLLQLWVTPLALNHFIIFSILPLRSYMHDRRMWASSF